MSIDHGRRKASEGGAAAANPAGAPDSTSPAQPTPATPDCIIPGVSPDLTGLHHWTEPAADPTAKKLDPVAQIQANLAAINGRNYAQVLVQNVDNTDNKKARWEFLNTLDRVDDPATRHQMMTAFAEQTGQSLEEFITQADWHGERDRAQALSLISPERDAAAARIEAMSPDEQKALKVNAKRWAQQVLSVTRTEEADDDGNAAGIYRALGQRTPEELEAIRAEIRFNTGGASIYEELDRSLSGNTEDEAVAGLSGDPLKAAWVGLRNVDNNPERTKEILRNLTPQQLAEFQAQAVVHGTGWITDKIPEGADREEVKQLLAGKQDAADGEHLANLLRDPLDGARPQLKMFGGFELDDQSKKFEAARSPQNIIREFEAMSPERLVAARDAYNKLAAERGGDSWEKLISDRFGDDKQLKARLDALTAGDRVESKALGLREALQANNQAEIERILANPDLNSDDPGKQAAARKERQALDARLQDLDRNDQYVAALQRGVPPQQIDVTGRDVSTQLHDHYADHEARAGQAGLIDTTLDVARGGIFGGLELGEQVVENVAARRETVRDNRYAAQDLWDQGQLSTSTQVRRASRAHDEERRLSLLENLESEEELRKVRSEYELKYGGDPLASKPEVAMLRLAANSRKMSGDSRPLDEIIADIGREQMSSNELRAEHLRQYGPTAARSDDQILRNHEELYDRQHSGPLEAMESWREFNGGNRGTEDLAKHQLAAERSMLTDGEGPFGWIGRKRRDAYAPEELAQQQRNTAETLTVHKSEKVKLAERNAEVLNKFALVASFIIGNPWLAIAFDAAVHAAKSKMKEAIAGEAYDESGDLRDFGVNMGIDAIFIALHANALAAAAGAGGGGLKPPPGAGTTAAISGRAATEAVDNAVTNEAKEAAVDQAVKDVATSAGATEKQATTASGKKASVGDDAAKQVDATKPDAPGSDAVAVPPHAPEVAPASPPVVPNLVKRGAHPELIEKAVADFGPAGVQAMEVLARAGFSAEVARETLELAASTNMLDEMVDLLNSGRLRHPTQVKARLQKVADEAKRGLNGTRNELMLAAERAEEGADVSIGGVKLKSGDATTGRADVVVYGKDGNASEAIQVKTVSSADADMVVNNADVAVSQLRREPPKQEANAKKAAKKTNKGANAANQHDESPPELAHKVAHVIIESKNPLHGADRSDLATELRGVIDDLRPGESLVIVNATGRHEFTAAKAP